VRHIIGAAFAAAAFMLVIMCMPKTGAIYTHDSQAYEYAAETLLQSGEMRYFGYDTPVIQWPPFYIIVAAAIKAFGVPFVQGAVWVNAFAFAYMLYACGVYLYESLSVKWMSVPALAMMTISVPLIYISGFAWTEMLFVFLSVLSAVFLLTYIKGEKTRWLVASAVVSALCWLTRYIGIAVIAALALVLFVSVKHFRDKLKKSFIYLTVSCFPMALWVLRNYLLSGTFTGGRQPGTDTLEENILFSFDVFREWSSFATPLFTRIAAVFFLALILLALFMKKERKKKKNTNKEKHPDAAAYILYVLLYSATLLVTSSKAAMDPISTRLWAPVYPFWILSLVFIFDSLIRNIGKKGAKQWLAAGFAVFALIASISPALWIQSEGFPRKDALMGSKEEPSIKNSPVLKLAAENIRASEDTLVISNDAAMLSLHTDLKCYYPPKKNSIPLYSFSRYSEKMEEFRDVYLVWSGALDSESFVDVPGFRQWYELEIIAQNNQCIIFRLK